MSTDKKKMTKEEKIKKAKKLMEQVKALELSTEEMISVAGGVATNCVMGSGYRDYIVQLLQWLGFCRVSDD